MDLPMDFNRIVHDEFPLVSSHGYLYGFSCTGSVQIPFICPSPYGFLNGFLYGFSFNDSGRISIHISPSGLPHGFSCNVRFGTDFHLYLDPYGFSHRFPYGFSYNGF